MRPIPTLGARQTIVSRIEPPRLPVVLLATVLLVAAAGALNTESDPEYDRLLQDNATHDADITAINALLAADAEAEESVLFYTDSLAANAELAAHEDALDEAAQADSILLAYQEEYEAAVAGDPDAACQIAAFDSLLADDTEFAARLAEVERLAAEDPELLASHGEAVAYLETHPDEAALVFADESGPHYTGTNPFIVGYVAYLTSRPAFYAGWWRLYRHLRTHPLTARCVYGHWRWLRPRTRLWQAGWTYRLRTALQPRVHRLVWARRLYLGRRPQLARGIWRHRGLLAVRPALRAQVHFLRQHPKVAHGLVKHRRWVRRHSPTAVAAPPRRLAEAPGPHTKPKPARKPVPAPAKRRPR